MIPILVADAEIGDDGDIYVELGYELPTPRRGAVLIFHEGTIYFAEIDKIVSSEASCILVDPGWREEHCLGSSFSIEDLFQRISVAATSEESCIFWEDMYNYLRSA